MKTRTYEERRQTRGTSAAPAVLALFLLVACDGEPHDRSDVICPEHHIALDVVQGARKVKTICVPYVLPEEQH